MHTILFANLQSKNVTIDDEEDDEEEEPEKLDFVAQNTEEEEHEDHTAHDIEGGSNEAATKQIFASCYCGNKVIPLFSFLCGGTLD